MNIFNIPRWIDQGLVKAKKLEDIPEEKIVEIRSRLKSVVSTDPVVSVVIAAWNEEVNIVKCVDSLSKSQTDLTFEIVVVNNNSTDRTQEVLDKIGVSSYIQPT